MRSYLIPLRNSGLSSFGTDFLRVEGKSHSNGMEIGGSSGRFLKETAQAARKFWWLAAAIQNYRPTCENSFTALMSPHSCIAFHFSAGIMLSL